MFSEITQVSILGVLTATVANFILGGIYFGVVIARRYAIAMGRENEPKQSPSALMIGGPLVCGSVMMLANAALIEILSIHTLIDALVFGTIIGVGYLAPMTTTISINPNFPRPFYYTAINAPYFLITNILGCVILVTLS